MDAEVKVDAVIIVINVARTAILCGLYQTAYFIATAFIQCMFLRSARNPKLSFGKRPEQ